MNEKRTLEGNEAVARQHERGLLTIRERVDGLVDPDSFREQGPIAGHSESDEGHGSRQCGRHDHVYVHGDGCGHGHLHLHGDRLKRRHLKFGHGYGNG